MNPANTHAFTACLCYPKLEEQPPCHWLWTQYNLTKLLWDFTNLMQFHSEKLKSDTFVVVV